MTRLFCLWLPNWPIQRVQAERSIAAEPEVNCAPSEAIDSPVVLWREDPRRGRLVAACCHQARAAGVNIAMPIAQASELVQSGRVKPRLLPHDIDADDRALRQIAWKVQQQITPLVETETLDKKPWAGCPRHQRESLIGEIGGVTHLFGSESGVLQAACQLLQRLGLHGRIAIADSLGAAWALAHFGSTEAAIGPGQWIIPSQATRGMLEPLPVESLRLDAPTAATLARLGVTRIGELLELPRNGLAARLGRGLVRRIEQALDGQQEPLAVETAPAEDRETWELEYPTSDQDILADRIHRLVKKIRTGLAARQRGAIRMTCRLDLAVPPSLFFEVGLFAPTVDEEHLTSLILHHLENKRLTSDVKRVTIEVPLSDSLRTAQTALFETDSSAANLSGSAISRLVDSLSGRLGRDSVTRVDLQDDPLPENAYRMRPMAGNARKRSKRSRHAQSTFQHQPISSSNSAELRTAARQSDSIRDHAIHLPSPDDAMRRPLCLFADPVPLSVAWHEGSFRKIVTTQQLPQRIRLAGVVHTVTRHWGPERIETGWWKGPTVRRDYYRIETDRGCWWWVFRNLDAPNSRGRYRWMLHGRFD
ncbi:MAG: DNA polymerase Y family protein [Planctomycetaceae bacterium]|nr:DNA polymerase Y family protein [Planctomycetaceae bacterium]